MGVAIQNNATELVGWNGASIVRAIRAPALPLYPSPLSALMLAVLK